MTEPGAAVVLVALADPDARELIARVVEGARHRAVRLDDGAPRAVVDTAVHELALVVVVDTRSTGIDDIEAITGAFATRGYPATVVVLVDGPATEHRALTAGARHVLCRPFHQRDLLAALDTALLPERAQADAEPETDAPRAKPVEVGHAFTDILRMGRQL